MIIGPLRGLSVRRMFRICDGGELQLSNERANCMSENNDAKHVLLVLISHSDLGGVRPTGFYVDEAAHPWQVFRRMGFTVGLASIAGGVPPQAGRHPGDPVQEQFLHDAVLFVGGHGVMWDFPNNSVVNAVGRNIWERGGIVPCACGIGGYDVVGWQLSDCRQAGHRIHQRRRAKSRALSVAAAGE